VLLGGWNQRHGQLFKRQIQSRSAWAAARRLDSAAARRLGNAAVSRGVREIRWFEKVRTGNRGFRDGAVSESGSEGKREKLGLEREKKLVYAIAKDGKRGSRWHLKNFKLKIVFCYRELMWICG
jgi:hypothetical protein